MVPTMVALSTLPAQASEVAIARSESTRAARANTRRCLRRGQPGPYQIQAAINAVHADTTGTGAQATDWGQILQLYDQLLAVAPSPVVALNRAVALAEVDGPAAALAVVDELGAAAGQGPGPSLGGYHVYYAIRADLLRRLGRAGEAAAAYDAALARTANAAGQDFLRRQRDQLTPPL